MLVGPVEDAPPGEWERMVAVNQLGLLYVTRAAQPHLAKAAASDPRHVADVVNIGLTAGRVARPGAAVYSMTMAGVVTFSESLRQVLQPQRIRVLHCGALRFPTATALARRLGVMTRPSGWSDPATSEGARWCDGGCPLVGCRHDRDPEPDAP